MAEIGGAGEESSAFRRREDGVQALEAVKMQLPEALRDQGSAALEGSGAGGEAGRVSEDRLGGKLLLDFEEPGEFCAVLEPSKVMVAADRLFIDRVEELVGRGGVRVIP